MKRIWFFIILSLFVVNIFSCSQTDTLPNDLGKKVGSPKGLKQVIDSRDSKFIIVDVRSATEYYKGHIPTAINIPGGIISDTKTPLPKDKYIILYCTAGLRSEEAGKRMLADGYKYILNWGGIMDWPYKLEASK